jgi:hypothetical protein
MAGSRGPDDVEGIGAVLAGCGRCRPKGVSSRAAAAAAERSCGFEVECNATLDDGERHIDCWINGTAGEALLPPGLKRAAVDLARRHGTVRACLASNQDGDDGPRFFRHDLRGYAGLPMSKVEGAPLVAAVGHAKSMGEMKITASLSYKRWTDAEDKRATDFFGPQSHPGPNASSLNLNGKPTGVMYAPIPKVRAVAVTPVECAREAAAALDSLERRRR